MYKKITHTIVEEHFDHPAAKQIKSRIERPRLPTTEIFDANTFRTSVSSAAQQYATNLNNIINAYSSSPNDFLTAFDEAFTNIDSLGNMTKPFLTGELGERMNLALRTFTVYSAMMIQAAKSQQDISLLNNRISNAALDLANTMQAYNYDWGQFAPDNSTTNHVRPILTEMANTINAKIKAKIAGNETVSTEMSAKLSSDLGNFGTAISESLIKRFPERFTTMSTAWAGCPPTPSPTPAPTAP